MDFQCLVHLVTARPKTLFILSRANCVTNPILDVHVNASVIVCLDIGAIFIKC